MRPGAPVACWGQAAKRTALVALFLLCCLVARADEIVVDQGGGGHFTTIKEAFDAAADGDTITVNPGTYSGELNREIIWGQRNLFLQSGMPRGPGEPPRFPTIDLEGEGRFLLLLSDVTDTTSIIAGFDIINGAARDFPEDGGGAILVQDASPKIQYCTFRACDGAFGGAVKLLYSNAKVQSCGFEGNTADSGGGLHVAYATEAVVERCCFSGNAATQQGGAMRFFGAVRVVRGCTIAGNASPQGGGIALLGGSAPSVERSIIAFSAEGAAFYGTPPANVTQCIVYGNAGGDALRDRDDVLNVDPLFCGFYVEDFTLCENSPALQDNNDWGVQVGRYGEGCPPCESPVTDAGWGVIKALYRRPGR